MLTSSSISSSARVTLLFIFISNRWIMFLKSINLNLNLKNEMQTEPNANKNLRWITSNTDKKKKSRRSRRNSTVIDRHIKKRKKNGSSRLKNRFVIVGIYNNLLVNVIMSVLIFKKNFKIINIINYEYIVNKSCGTSYRFFRNTPHVL